MITVHPSPMTVADYCQAYEDKKILVNRDYQRRGGVWPEPARSFLIESIVLGYPIPKFSLHQVMDLKSRSTVKEIVDGQQRTAAIHDFFAGTLRLGRGIETEDLAGRTYEELSEEHQEAFLSYPLSIDLFVGATQEEIREVFRRINSYTVPLNPEEERHAQWQGEFKWYIYHLARAVEATFDNSGVLSQREFVRMQDAKLLTEVTHAIDNGIVTTSKKHLNAIYKRYNSAFPHKEEYRRRVTEACAVIDELREVHHGPLMRGYIVYALILAITHTLDPIEQLRAVIEREPGGRLDLAAASRGLVRLGDALEQKEDYRGVLKPFVEGCMGRTNVKSQREIRVKWLTLALIGELPED